MDCGCKQSNSKRDFCAGNNKIKQDGFWDGCNKGKNSREACSKGKQQKRGCRSSSAKPPVDFHQAITKVKCRMDNTFRNLEDNLRGIEAGVNAEVADILAQVIDFEERMKPRLLGPYKKCKELESLISPVLARTPKRPASARCRPQPQQQPVTVAERCKSAKSRRCPDSATTPMQGKERFQKLMYAPSLDRVNPWEGSQGRCNSYDMQRDPCDNSTTEESTEDDVERTMQELQDISISVNKSLKRINRAVIDGNNCRQADSAAAPNPDMLHRVNNSLAHIGAGAKLLRKLLLEERAKGNC